MIGIETLEENKREEMRMMKDRGKNAVIKKDICAVSEKKKTA